MCFAPLYLRSAVSRRVRTSQARKCNLINLRRTFKTESVDKGRLRSGRAGGVASGSASSRGSRTSSLCLVNREGGERQPRSPALCRRRRTVPHLQSQSTLLVVAARRALWSGRPARSGAGRAVLRRTKPTVVHPSGRPQTAHGIYELLALPSPPGLPGAWVVKPTATGG